LFALIGELGSETTELIRISSITTATNTLVLASNTKYSHAESTKVTLLKYDQIRFYYTSTSTFSSSAPLNNPSNLQVDDLFTRYYDATNTSGYGWFRYYNSYTGVYSASNSNAIPYTGFNENSAKRIINDFFSILNNKEQKLISIDDAYSWMNEAYSIIRNELNLVNKEYNASSAYTLTITPPSQEVALPEDFSDALSVYDTVEKKELEKLSIKELSAYNDVSGNTTKYYLRGAYIGISPVPTSVVTYTLRYLSNGTVMNSFYDSLSLPDNNFYCIKDFMLFRAAPKLNRLDGPTFLAYFRDGVNRLKITAVRRDSDGDSWGIHSRANV